MDHLLKSLFQNFRRLFVLSMSNRLDDLVYTMPRNRSVCKRKNILTNVYHTKILFHFRDFESLKFFSLIGQDTIIFQRTMNQNLQSEKVFKDFINTIF